MAKINKSVRLPSDLVDWFGSKVSNGRKSLVFREILEDLMLKTIPENINDYFYETRIKNPFISLLIMR